MSKIYADTIETENSNVDITLGAAGDAVLIPTGATLKTNKIADAGGNNIITSDGSGSLTVNSGLASKEILLTTNTFTDQASSVFTTKITSTYDLYKFVYISINPATDATDFSFQCSIDGGSNYNVTITTTAFQAYHMEDDTGSTLAYNPGEDLAQSTGYQILGGNIGNAAAESAAGILYLYNPSSTTYVKHFTAESQFYRYVDRSNNSFFAGYFNTTSAINAISFKMSSGNMDGIIKMYGISST